MSLSRPNTNLSNPAKMFITWNGVKGLFEYYDKTVDPPVNREIKLPFKFIILDELTTISGFSETFGCGIYSNEVRNTTQESLKVKTFKPGINLLGLYKDIKSDIVAAGGKYAKSIYVCIRVNGEFMLANLKLSGSSFSSWYDFCKKHKNREGMCVVVEDFHSEKKGAVVYNVPNFTVSSATDETIRIATDLDAELQTYLDQSLSKKSDAPESNIEEYHDEIPEDAYLTPKLDEAIREMESEGMPVDDDNEDLPF